MRVMSLVLCSGMYRMSIQQSVTALISHLLRSGILQTGRACCRETEAALNLWSDLRSNASTPSTFLEPGFLRAVPVHMGGSETSDRPGTPAATASSTRANVSSDNARAAQPVAACGAAATGSSICDTEMAQDSTAA